MPASGNFNMQDPAKQEQIRRGSHEYVTGEGRHGTYVAKTYHHQEYPKIMDLTPTPNRKSFKSDDEYQNALKEWDGQVTRSMVHNKTEETKWLEEHKEEAAEPRKKSKAA
jgi:hypothetical protein